MKQLAMTLILISLVIGCSKSPQEKQKEAYGDFVEAVDQLKFEEAAEAEQRLAEVDPNSPLARLTAGLVLERRLWYHDALQVYLEINDRYPAFADAQIASWRMFRELGLSDEEMRAAVAYRALLPEDGVSAVAMALSMLDNNLPERVHAYLDSAVAQGLDEGMASMIHARAYIAADRPKEAGAAYEEGLAQAGTSADVFAHGASYLEAAGLVDSAITISRKAMSLAKGNFNQGLRHFRLAVRHNYFAEADEVIRNLRAAGADREVVSFLEALSYDAQGLLSPAKDAIDRSVAWTGPTIASRIWESEIKIKGSDELALMTNFQYFGAMIDRDSLGQEFEDLLAYLVGVQAGRWFSGTMGIPYMKEVPAKYQGRRDWKLLWTQAVYESGQADRFNADVEEILKVHGRQSEWVSGLANIYAHPALRQYDRAAELYAQALELDHWNQTAFVSWVAMYRELGQYDKIAQLFDTYSHFAERSSDLATLEGICLVEGGHADRGVDVYLMNAPMNRGDERRHRELYEALAERWLVADIARLADFIKTNCGKNVRLLTLAAEMRLEIGEKEAGLALAEEALAIQPDLLEAKAQKARAQYLLGQTEAALALLEANLAVDEYHISSNIWLSRILAMEGRDPNQAQNIARRAVFDSRHGLAAWSNLSYVYRRTGRPDLSRGEALKMVGKYQRKALPLYCLGMALYAENKTGEARSRLEEAIAKGLSGEPLTDARDVLAKLQS